MFCANCGTQNADGHAFCRNCGTPLAPASAPAPAPTPVAANHQQASANQQAPSYVQQQTYQPAPAPEGVLGAAWRDITGTPGWFKKVMLLCLVSCVPILNFSAQGYALRWARELSFGERNPLPKEIFKKKEILTGFRACLVVLAFLAVFFIIGSLAILLLAALFSVFGPTPASVVTVILIIVLSIVFFFFFLPLIDVSIMRMTVVDYLEAAFNLPKTWKAFRSSMGGAIGAAVVPPLVIGLIQSIILGIFYAIIFGIAYANMGSMHGYAYSSYYMSNPMNLIFNMGAGAMFFYLVVQLLMVMLSTFSMLLSMRAFGHWASRNAKEWVAESDEETFASYAEARQAATESAPDNPTQFVAPAPAAAPDGATTQMDATPAPQITLVRVATGASYTLDNLPATVGKGSAADVTIEGTDKVSRVHVGISRTANGFAVEDLNATNGTMLNGVALQPETLVPLVDGDTLKLADEEFAVSIR